ncbi:hypothetical protein GR204_35400 [Rhizobium leguminosarum]|uniref:Uncharacterized protein n=1 Tax=Rhizobium leguminosarum TaxID=384 RepID=A0A6P0BH22_RHILE|nr:hypothetical protein [Rhizobium leguminosarum]NEI45804.1 hypothetical protein [Rhizobium leguminosarum]
MANATLRLGEAAAACPFAPPAGRRCRQADEGLVSAISRAKACLKRREHLKTGRINTMQLVHIFNLTAVAQGPG